MFCLGEGEEVTYPGPGLASGGQEGWGRDYPFLVQGGWGRVGVPVLLIAGLPPTAPVDRHTPVKTVPSPVCCPVFIPPSGLSRS